MRVSNVNICVFVYIKKKNSGRARTAGKLTPMVYNDPDPYKVLFIIIIQKIESFTFFWRGFEYNILNTYKPRVFLKIR